MPTYGVTVTKEVSSTTCIYIAAPSEEDIHKNSTEITNFIDNNYAGNDWEFEDTWGASLSTVHLLKNAKDVPDFFLVKGQVSTDKKLYVEWEAEMKKKKRLAPLPGQMGIPGVGEDVPK